MMTPSEIFLSTVGSVSFNLKIRCPGCAASLARFRIVLAMVVAAVKAIAVAAAPLMIMSNLKSKRTLTLD